MGSLEDSMVQLGEGGAVAPFSCFQHLCLTNACLIGYQRCRACFAHMHSWRGPLIWVSLSSAYLSKRRRGSR